MTEQWPQFEHPAVPWWGLPAVNANGDSGVVAAPPVSHFPLPGWPAQQTLEYFTKLLALGLLLLAIPYLLGRLITAPASLIKEVGSARTAKSGLGA